jgi:hypothetical protein
MTGSTPKTPTLTLPLARISDLVLKPLDWVAGQNVIDKPQYTAQVFGRKYLVTQNDNGSWHFSAGGDPGSNKYRSAEEAISAAEDDYKGFVRGFLSETVDAVVSDDVVAFPVEPDEASIRALFTLNTGNARSTAEVTQVYGWLRNLAAQQSGEGDRHGIRAAAVERVLAYLERRRRAHGTVYEEIHNYDTTSEGGIQLLASDLEILAGMTSRGR